MEELITIAFSSVNSRLECVEKEIKNIYKVIEEFSEKLDNLEKDVSKLAMIIYGDKDLKKDVDEMEVYKFGE